MGFMGCLSLCIHPVLTGQPDVRPRVHVWGQAQWLANAGVLMGVGMHGKICMYIKSAAVCSVRLISIAYIIMTASTMTCSLMQPSACLAATRPKPSRALGMGRIGLRKRQQHACTSPKALFGTWPTGCVAEIDWFIVDQPATYF